MTPDVSIVIPNYNCLPHLPDCLASIRAQQELNNERLSFEIIVIDDGSTDGSLAWLQAESVRDPRLRVFAESGLGAGGARNLAVQLCRAELVAFLDADDIWYPYKLARQIAYHHANPTVVLSFGDYDHIEEHSQNKLYGCFEYWPHFRGVSRRTLLSEPGYVKLLRPCSTLFAENVVGTSSAMIRKSAFMAVSGFDTSLKSASDWDLWLKLAQVGGVAFTHEKTMGYLMRAGSMTGNKINRLAAMEIIFARHLGSAANELYRSIFYARARLAVGYCELYRSEGKRLKSLRCSLQACFYVPNINHFKMVIKEGMRLLL